ncbi:YjzC family protein [Paenibacillus chungangensis]|uniref:YjzC family protein n=1 Tax=Paenibacillus chungangensis TaxID=696535 RepID=A0ABW3HW78_9BACL
MMGEFTTFSPGDRAPNNGTYIETGVNDYHMGIENPRKVRLNRGEKFPGTSNHERKWKKMPKD